MKQQQTKEDYLKTIYLLSKTQEVHGVNIAESLGVTRPTVSVSLKSLQTEGHLYIDDNHVVHLTDTGEQIAKDTYERHQTIKNLLIAIGVDEKTASCDACKLEHVVSQKTFTALKRFIIREKICKNYMKEHIVVRK